MTDTSIFPTGTEGPNEAIAINGMRLGKLPAKGSPKALMASSFLKVNTAEPPKATNYWKNKSPFPLLTWGNDKYGDCTRAKQAAAQLRMERIETRKLIEIAEDEVVRVYFEMTKRLYGGGDVGAYETDALDCWRREDYTFRGTNGKPYTIDAYLTVNKANIVAIKNALATAKAHGIALCFNLPLAWSKILPPQQWDVAPNNQPLVGDWVPGTWGGHSMWGIDYDAIGLWVTHTWALQPQRVTWAAVMAYLDEAYICIDSIDKWRKMGLLTTREAKVIKDAVNQVSTIKLK